MLKNTKRRLLAFAVALLVLITAKTLVRAQVCGGTSMTSSTLQYIVRDAKGSAIDAAQKDLEVAKSDSARGGWGFSDKDFIGKDEGKWNIKAPEAITSLVGRVGVIKASSSPMCNFAAAQSLELTLAGKKMRLIFLTPHLPQYQSVEFLVDSIPFEEGIYTINLPTVPDGEPKFYEAGGWKKITEAEASMIQAEASMWNHDYVKAVENWKRAATLNPDNPKIPRMLGFSLMETRQYKDAVATLQQAVQLNPKSGITQSSLAQAYWLNGQKPESAEAFSMALRIGRNDPECDEEWINRTIGDLKRSLAELDKTQPAPTDAKGWSHDGALHYQAGMYTEAAARLEQARKLDPKNKTTLKLLAMSYGRSDNDPAAIAVLKEAVQLDPNDANLHGLLGESYLNSKLYQEAVDSFRKAAQLQPDDKFWQENLQKAQAALNASRESKPGNSQPAAVKREVVKVDPKLLDEYAGQYQMPETDRHQSFVLTVTREGEKLMSEAFGRRAEFLPYSSTEFFLREEGVELRFVRGADGKVSYIDWGGTRVRKIK